MEQLPFLVAYGWWVGKLILIVPALVGVIVYARILRRREQREIESLVGIRTDALGPLAAGNVTIQGRLIGSVTSLVQSPVADVPRSARSEQLMIESASHKIALIGRVDALRGTVATVARRGAPPGTPAELTDGISREAHRLFAVKTDDEVLIQGTLEPGGPDGAAWSLTPTATNAWLELVPVTPAIRPPAMRVAGIAVAALLAGVVGYGGLRWYGKHLVDGVRDRTRNDREKFTAVPGALAVASALPGSRAEAIHVLSGVAEFDFVRNEAERGLVYGIARVSDGCHGEVKGILDDARPELALGVAQKCDDVVGELESLMSIGRYADAAQVANANASLEPPPRQREDWVQQAVAANLAVGDYAHAAAQLDRLAEVWLHPDQTYLSGSDLETARSRAQCLAGYLRAKLPGGKAGALIKAAGAAPTVACATDLALLVPDPAARDAALTAAHEAYEHTHGDVAEIGDALLADDLRWFDGDGDPSYGPWSVLLSETAGRVEPFAAKFALAATTDPRARARVLRQVAELDAILGDAAPAQGHLAQAAQLDADIATAREATRDHLVDDGWRPTPERTDPATDDTALGIALRGSRLDLPKVTDPGYSLIGGLVQIRRGEVRESFVAEMSEDCSTTSREVIAASRANDGGALADYFAACTGYLGRAELFALLPRLASHKDEIASLLRINAARIADYPAFALRHLAVASQRRDLARIVGDETSAVFWQGVVDRERPLLADRDKLLATMLFENLR